MLFQGEGIRAVFLAEGEGLLLPELEYLNQISGRDAVTAEPEASQSMEETGDLPQDLPVVSRGEVEEFLADISSKAGEPKVELDPEILSRFTLVRANKEEFSLVYDPEFLKDLKINPQEEFQRKKLVGLPYPYGVAAYKKISGQFGSLNPVGASPQPLGQTSAQLQIKDLSPWAEQVLKRIERNWIIDPTQSQDLKRTVSISVTITKSGDISNVEVIKSSGVQMLDLSAKNAVERSFPLPGLPIMYPEKFIVFTIEFEYDV